MKSYVLGIIGGTFLLSLWATSHLARSSLSLTFLDLPNDRSLHTQPTPRTGGVAILISLFVGFAVIYALGRMGLLFPFEANFWIIGMSTLTIVVSCLDDQKGVQPNIRFGVHIVAALGIIYGAKLTIEQFTAPIFGNFPLGILSAPVTLLFILWMMNLYNFMDGMDGFAGGMTLFGFFFFGIIFWSHGYSAIAMISFLVSGTIAGFLFFNFPPAKIFLGDTGSVSLGFLSAILALYGIKENVFDIWVPLLIFSPFIVDATVTLLSRAVRGKKVWQAHREHYYQRLVLSGWSHRRTVLVEYGIMVLCGANAILYTHSTAGLRLTILLGWIAIYASLIALIHVLELGTPRKIQ